MLGTAGSLLRRPVTATWLRCSELPIRPCPEGLEVREGFWWLADSEVGTLLLPTHSPPATITAAIRLSRPTATGNEEGMAAMWMGEIHLHPGDTCLLICTTCQCQVTVPLREQWPTRHGSVVVYTWNTDSRPIVSLWLSSMGRS